jgi:hypothetical protein
MDGTFEDNFPYESLLGKRMNDFEEYLRCPCCSEFFDNPNSLQCGHVYCSECIRKHFDPLINSTTHDSCPNCRVKADAAQLRPDKAMANLLQVSDRSIYLRIPLVRFRYTPRISFLISFSRCIKWSAQCFCQRLKQI